MIEAPKHLSRIRKEVITEGKVMYDGQPLKVLHGVSTDLNPNGITERTEVVITEQPGGILKGYRLVDTPNGRNVDLMGIQNASTLDSRTRAKLMTDAVIVASSVDEETHVPGEKLDMEKKPDRMMRLLLSEADILKNLPPLLVHTTGPGNKYEAIAYAQQQGISIERARAALVLMPNTERMVGPNRS